MRIPYIVKAIVVAVPVGTWFVNTVGYVARVDGSSMKPALNLYPNQNDYVFLNKWAVRNFNISKGEIISIISPNNPDVNLIKRVVALEGESVFTKNILPNYVRIPQGHCWVEGDFQATSIDSNSFGPVALGLVVAKATHIIWPPSRWRAL